MKRHIFLCFMFCEKCMSFCSSQSLSMSLLSSLCRSICYTSTPPPPSGSESTTRQRRRQASLRLPSFLPFIVGVYPILLEEQEVFRLRLRCGEKGGEEREGGCHISAASFVLLLIVGCAVAGCPGGGGGRRIFFV